jgi:sensor histidine kinase regulating citrate/malate metabolism
MYPAAMFTQTIFAVLVAYGAFQYQLTGILFRPQPRIVLASITYALIASGIALAFTDSASKLVLVYLLAILFVSFNIYHYLDDLAYLIQKYLGAQLQPYFHRNEDGSSILFNNAEIGILALDTQQKVLFTNTKAAQILGPEMMEANDLSALQNDILRKKLEMNIGRKNETIISLDGETSVEITPIDFGQEYLGTLICFYPKAREPMHQRRRRSRYARLDLRNIFRRD